MPDISFLNYNKVPIVVVSIISRIDVLKYSIEKDKEKKKDIFSDMERSSNNLLSKISYKRKKHPLRNEIWHCEKKRIYFRKNIDKYNFTVNDIRDIYYNLFPENANFDRLDDSKIISHLEMCCSKYENNKEDEDIHPLLSIVSALYDFIKLQLFEEGSIDTAEVLMEIMLNENEYDFFKYSQMEIFEIRALFAQLELLYSANNVSLEYEFSSFMMTFLTWVENCYKKLEKRIEIKESGITYSKVGRIEKVLEVSSVPLSKKDIAEILPDVSESTIESHLGKMKKNDMVEITGKARATTYTMKK